MATSLSIGEDLQRLGDGVQVAHGTIALLKIEGQSVNVIGAGHYLFDQAILIQAGRVSLTLLSVVAHRLAFEPVETQDRRGLIITVPCKVSVRVAAVEIFDARVVGGRDRVTETDVVGLTIPFLARAVHDELREHDAISLDRDARTNDSARRNIADRLAIEMGAYGLEIAGVEIGPLSGASIAEIRRLRSESALRSEHHRHEQETTATKAEQERFHAQVRQGITEHARSLAHDSQISEQERKLYLELQSLTSEDKINDLRSKNRIAELIRSLEEVHRKRDLDLARVNGEEEVKNRQLDFRHWRNEETIQHALRLSQLVQAQGQHFDALAELITKLNRSDAVGAYETSRGIATGASPTEDAKDRKGDTSPRSPDAILFDGVRPFRGSVGLVVAVGSDLDVKPIGTAWVWKGMRGGCFAATNAHVAESAENHRSSGARIEWRLSGRNAPGLEIESWRLHYYYRQSGGTFCGGKEGGFHGDDVALMKIKHAGSAALTPLPIASSTEIRRTAESTRLASWCYPCEGIVGINFDQVQSFFREGYIVGVSDYHFRPIIPKAEPKLFHHNLPAVGGSSGSPIFAMCGDQAKVVGIMCAGNMHLNMARFESDEASDAPTLISVRIPSAAQQNFALPVSLLKEVTEPV